MHICYSLYFKVVKNMGLRVTIIVFALGFALVQLCVCMWDQLPRNVSLLVRAEGVFRDTFLPATAVVIFRFALIISGFLFIVIKLY